jgi:hypothetical protein
MNRVTKPLAGFVWVDAECQGVASLMRISYAKEARLKLKDSTANAQAGTAKLRYWRWRARFVKKEVQQSDTRAGLHRVVFLRRKI